MLFRHPLLLLTCVISFLLPSGAHASGYADFWVYGSTTFHFHDDGSKTIADDVVGSASTSSYSIASENGKPLFYGTYMGIRKLKENWEDQRVASRLSMLRQPQTAAFLPVSGSSTLYKLIYTSSSGLKYATLDSSKENSDEILIESDVPISGTHQSKAITLVNHANGKDVWIISYIGEDVAESTGVKGVFEAVLFNGTRFSKKTIWAPWSLSKPNSLKFIKLSPDGTKLAYIAQEDSSPNYVGYGVCTFDNATGTVSTWFGGQLTKFSEDWRAAGVSFSADSKYCYIGVGSTGEKPQFYQLDLEDPLRKKVLMDVTLPEGESNALIGNGQLAPDGNIYYNSGIYAYELSIKNPEKAYDGTESGAHVVFRYNLDVREPSSLPSFNQSYLFKQPLMLKWDNANLQIDIDSTRLPEGTLQSYGICWSDSDLPTIADNKLSTTSPSAPPVWNMNDHLTEGSQYTIRSFATIDGSTYYYDEKKLTWLVPPIVDTTGSTTHAKTGKYVSLRLAPIVGCKYQWRQVSGPDLRFYKKTGTSVSFSMPESDVLIRVAVTAANGASASKLLEVKNGFAAVIETPVNVSNNGWQKLVGQEVEDATYLWEQTGGPSVSIVNPNSRIADFYTSNIADGTPLTFKLTVTDEHGVSSVESKVITVHSPPIITFEGLVTQAKAGTRVDLKVQPEADVTYLWEKYTGVPVTLHNADTAHAYFTMHASASIMRFTIVATNSYGIKNTEMVTIRRSVPPVAQAGPDQNVTEGETVTLSAFDSSCTQGDNLTIVWTQTSGQTVALTKKNYYDWTFVAPEVPASGESLTFQLEVTDSTGESDTDFITVNVKDTGNPPLLAPLMLLLN